VRGRCLPGGFGVAGLYRLQDGVVLGLHFDCKVDAPGFVGPRHLRGPMQKLAQVFQRLDQKRVACRVGNGPVKLHVFGDPVAPGFHGGVQRFDRLLNGANVMGVAALGGQCGHFGLECAAHLDHLNDGLLRGRMARLEVERRKGQFLVDKDPAALA